MRGWFVRPDGRPACHLTNPSARPDLSALAFITVPIPSGMHVESQGKFAKWNFVSSAWETDAAREADYADEQNQRDQLKTDARAGFQFINANKNDASLSALERQMWSSLIEVFKFIAKSL